MAGNESAAPDTLRELRRDAESDVRAYAAGNRSTSADALRELAEDLEFDVVKNVAGNSQTPEDVLARLAGLRVCTPGPNNWIDVLEAIAENCGAGAVLLSKLARHKDDSIRELVAANPATPAPIREQLAEDRGRASWVIAANQETSVERLRWMATHHCGGKRKARERLEALMKARIEKSLTSALPRLDPRVKQLLDRARSAQQIYIRAQAALVEGLNLPSTLVRQERLNDLDEMASQYLRRCLKERYRWDRDLCPWFEEVSLDDLAFSDRTRNCLQNSKWKTVGELAQVDTARLMKLRNFGSKCLVDVEDLLDVQFGIRLPGSDRPPLSTVPK